MDSGMFTFIGIVVGAVLQYLFSRHQESLRAHRAARTAAYTDYLRCVSQYANPDQSTSSDGHDLAAKAADAKCRICLYGSSNAIEAFAQFERLGAAMSTSAQQEAFAEMVAIMRSDSTSSKEVATKDLQIILLGRDSK
jgi:hypothetical protein